MSPSFSRTAMRWLEYVAYPIAAGTAFVILSLGIVTWLPAAAAMAYALQRWRVDGDSHCFANVFRGWRLYRRALLLHGIASTLAVGLLAADVVFLLDRREPVAFLLLALQAGILAAFVIYHLALAVVAAQAPSGRVTEWCRDAITFGFGSVNRGTALLSAAIAAPILTVVIPLGPLLLGTSLPVLVALSIYERESR